MRGKILGVAAAVSLGLLIPVPAYAAQAAKAKAVPDTVSVDGQGSVAVVPDVMYLNAGVDVRRKSVGEAYDAAGAAANKVIKVLVAQGVARKDIRTAALSVQPEYVPDHYPKIAGYRASEGIRAVVRNLAKASKVIKAVASTGDAVRVDGISFDKADWSKETEAARALAFKAAHAKAKQLAKLGGRKLGRLLSVTAGGFDPVPVQSLTPKAVMADGAAIEPGESEARVTVSLVYALAGPA
ncbi:hypothetical protein GCM10027589_29490 [Actinocorallia lasiicapitis]